jgi:tyrosine-protein kinase Etk/Wzc
MPTDTSPSRPHEPLVSGPPVPPARPGANEDAEVSLLDILIIIAARKRIIFWTTAAFAVTAIVISLLLPKRYTATVSLLPPQQNSSISTALAAQLGNLGGMASLASGSLGLKNPNDMYVAMLKSRTVEDAMVQRFGLMKEYHSKYSSDARVDFEHHAAVDGSGKDNLIRVSVWDKDPNRAAEIANGYINEFRALSEHLAITEASQRRLFFEQQLEEAKDNLAKAEEAMKVTEQKTGVIQLDSQARALIESAAALRAQIAAKEVQIQSLRTFATSENSQLVQAQQELDGLRSQLAKLGGSEDGSDTALMVPKGRVPEAGLEYVRRLRDVKYSETIFEILARQFEMAKLDEAKQGALIQVVDAAVPPDKRSFPRRALIVIGATVVGFFVGIFAVLIQAGLERLRADVQTANKITLLRSLLSFRKARPEHAS